MTDRVKKNIKQRSVLTDYLEHLYLEKALDSFFKSKAKKFPFYVNISNLQSYYKHAEYFTRTWLSFMDNEEFNEVVRSRLNKTLKKLPESLLESQI
jgi:hypothetical protein